VIERALLHGVLHLVVPALAARLFWRRRWKRVAAALILMNLVDLDHLLATPVYDPGRCSLGFHPLHSWPRRCSGPASRSGAPPGSRAWAP
jgi:hypothetical protein